MRMMRNSVSRIVLACASVTALAGRGCTSSLGTSRPVATAEAPAAAGAGVIRLPKASLDYIRTASVEDVSAALELRVPARVEFRETALSRVGAPVAGRVVSLAVKAGDRVRAGDPLLTLASPEAAAARTALAAARAALTEAQAAADREDRMMQAGVGIERERVEAQARLSEAQAEVERAEATAGLIGEGHGATLVMRSPIAGSVLGVRASVGSAVEPGGDPLIEIGDPSATWIVADVPARDVVTVAEGDAAELEFGASPAPLAGRVVSVGSVVSDALRTAPVRVVLDAPPPGLRPGTFGRARIKTRVRATTLPSEAVLIRGGTETVVYVATADDTFERRSVVVGKPIDGRVQVVSGLGPGDRVVVSGALLLDGAAEQLL
jgi:cobalt-zinc-cadmium efflux system membrane fusion protein